MQEALLGLEPWDLSPRNPLTPREKTVTTILYYNQNPLKLLFAIGTLPVSPAVEMYSL
jgi:hypothetical protein